MTGEPFDPGEAKKLILGAASVAEELIGDDELEFTVALHRAAREAEKRAEERSAALDEFHRSIFRLCEYATSAVDRGDMRLVRAAVGAIRRETEKEFARREGLG